MDDIYPVSRTKLVTVGRRKNTWFSAFGLAKSRDALFVRSPKQVSLNGRRCQYKAEQDDNSKICFDKWTYVLSIEDGRSPTIATRRLSHDFGLRLGLMISSQTSASSSNRKFRFPEPCKRCALFLNPANSRFAIAKSSVLSERLICLPATLIIAKYVLLPFRYKHSPTRLSTWDF